MSNIDLAIIGFGRIGRIHAANILAEEDISLKMIVDPLLDVDERLVNKGIKQSKNIDDILDFENIDGVIICSPSNYHVDQIKQVSQNNISIGYSLQIRSLPIGTRSSHNGCLPKSKTSFLGFVVSRLNNTPSFPIFFLIAE